MRVGVCVLNQDGDLTEIRGKRQGVLGYQASGKGRHHRHHDDLLFTNSIRPAPGEPVCLGKDQQTPGKRLSDM